MKITPSWVEKAGLQRYLTMLLSVVLGFCMSVPAAQAIENVRKGTAVKQVRPGGPIVKFTGNPRACAGHIDDSVHKFTLSFTVVTKPNQDGISEPMPGAQLVFRFKNNIGHNSGSNQTVRKAMFVTNQYTEELTLTADSQGSGNITVISSDIITDQISIEPKWINASGAEENVEVWLNGQEAGELRADFAPIHNYRRFGIVGEPGDTGWKFDDALLFEGRGDTSPAKFWLKFQKDPSIPIDTNYFEEDLVTPRVPSDLGNWNNVNSHRLIVQIDEIVLTSGESVSPEDFDEFVTLVHNGTPVYEVEVETSNDGSAQVWLKSSDRIMECQTILLGAYELTQFID